MTKKLLLGLIIGSILLFIINAIFSGKQTNPASQISPTPSGQEHSIRNIKNSDFYVVSTDPAKDSAQLLPNQKITITFNKTFTLDDVLIYFSPVASYSAQIKQASLIINPQSLTENTIYTYSIRDLENHLLTTKSFYIGSSKTPQLPAKGDDNLESYWNEQQIAAHPDFFVANTLASSPQPEVSFKLVQNPAHYQFTIVSSNKIDGKNTFINWLHSIGLKDTDISKLDIVSN